MRGRCRRHVRLFHSVRVSSRCSWRRSRWSRRSRHSAIQWRACSRDSASADLPWRSPRRRPWRIRSVPSRSARIGLGLAQVFVLQELERQPASSLEDHAVAAPRLAIPRAVSSDEQSRVRTAVATSCREPMSGRVMRCVGRARSRVQQQSRPRSQTRRIDPVRTARRVDLPDGGASFLADIFRSRDRWGTNRGGRDLPPRHG